MFPEKFTVHPMDVPRRIDANFYCTGRYDWIFSVSDLITWGMSSRIVEANVSLNLFRAFREMEPSVDFYSNEHRNFIKLNISRSRDASDAFSKGDPLEEHAKLNRMLAEERWSSGIPPFQFNRKATILQARSFVYALDSFEKLLRELEKILEQPEGLKVSVAEIDNARASVDSAHGEFTNAFPDLLGVRDSAHHFEDRIQAKQYGKPIPIVPWKDTEFLTVTPGPGAPARKHIIDQINGSKYGCTMRNGHYGEIDVSDASMVELLRIYSLVLASFKWLEGTWLSPMCP